MKKRISAVFLIFVLIICVFPSDAYGNEAYVTVKLPAFDVILNGLSIENKTSQYPLIVYKDITYFPMTYYDSRFLGLESIWNSSTGLTIAKTGISWKYHKYQAVVPNNNICLAKTAPFNIKVNGKNIDNSKEEYPLLIFRNITYFPLTWRFAVEEFGWEYSFDREKGLVITSTKVGAAAGQLTLPIATRENGKKGAFTMAGDFFYYEGSAGTIYQVPVTSLENVEKVYQLPKKGDGYVFANLKTERGRALLSYHTGGAVMGSDHLIWLKEDGSFKEIDSGYSVMKIYDDYQIRVNQGVPPFSNNLQIRKLEETEYKSAGSPDFLYGWIWTTDSGGASGIPSEDLYLMNDEIYVLGYFDKDSTESTTGIYKVNINTHVTERVCEEAATGFRIVDDMIYYTDFKDALYQIPVAGGRAEKMTDEAVSYYNALNGKVYYTLKSKNDQLYIYGNDEPVNSGGRVTSLEIQNGYMVAVFDKESESQYKMMIFNDSGEVIYKTIENVLLVRIENGKVVFVKDN